jgi:scavenger receptor class B, member 1
MQRRTWHFIPELSNGTLDDHITSLNVPVVVSRLVQPVTHRLSLIAYIFTFVCPKKGAAYWLRSAPFWHKIVFNSLIKNYKTELFVTKTARELLFDGYEDPLLDLASVDLWKFVPYDKFAYFYQVNTAVHCLRHLINN